MEKQTKIENKPFIEKLIEFQSLVGAVQKTKDNPFFKSKYADINIYLAEIKPKLTECGLFLKQPIEYVEGAMVLKTIITDGTDSIESTMPIPDLSDIQKLGGAITYLRRYSLQALLSLEAEDDDGNQMKDQNIELTEKRIKELAKIETVEALKTYYEKNKGLGSEFAKAVTARKKELEVVTPEEFVEALKK